MDKLHIPAQIFKLKIKSQDLATLNKYQWWDQCDFNHRSALPYHKGEGKPVFPERGVKPTSADSHSYNVTGQCNTTKWKCYLPSSAYMGLQKPMMEGWYAVQPRIHDPASSQFFRNHIAFKPHLKFYNAFLSESWLKIPNLKPNLALYILTIMSNTAEYFTLFSSLNEQTNFVHAL